MHWHKQRIYLIAGSTESIIHLTQDPLQPPLPHPSLHSSREIEWDKRHAAKTNIAFHPFSPRLVGSVCQEIKVCHVPSSSHRISLRFARLVAVPYYTPYIPEYPSSFSLVAVLKAYGVMG